MFSVCASHKCKLQLNRVLGANSGYKYILIYFLSLMFIIIFITIDHPTKYYGSKNDQTIV